MRVLVCGSRHSDNYEIPKFIEKLDEYPITTVISGEARGFDTLAKIYASAKNLDYKGYPADWNKYGKGAGPIRNKQMLDEGKPDLVIAFMAENSRGTKNMVEQAKKAGVETVVVGIGRT